LACLRQTRGRQGVVRNGDEARSFSGGHERDAWGGGATGTLLCCVWHAAWHLFSLPVTIIPFMRLFCAFPPGVCAARFWEDSFFAASVNDTNSTCAGVAVTVMARGS
jgi:hypothetical protein